MYYYTNTVIHRFMMSFYSIGIETEVMIADGDGKPVCIDHYPDFLSQVESWLSSVDLPEFGREPSADTLEFKTYPSADLRSQKRQLGYILKDNSPFRALCGQFGLKPLFLGLNPLASQQNFCMTQDKSGYFNRLAQEDFLQARTTNICGVHLNFFVPFSEENLLMPLLYSLQDWGWPVSTVMQSSSVYDGKATNYMGSRQILWDCIHPGRTGPMPEGLKDWEGFSVYMEKLRSNGITDKPTKIWWDVRPKIIDRDDPSQGFLAEMRMGDTADYGRTVVFMTVMKAVCDALLDALRNGKSVQLYDSKLWMQQTRENILRDGRNALVMTGREEMGLSAFAKDKLAPLAGERAGRMLLEQLRRPTLAERTLLQFKIS